MAKKLKDALKQRESKLILNERCPSFYNVAARKLTHLQWVR